jgi:hypothetical protein
MVQSALVGGLRCAGPKADAGIQLSFRLSIFYLVPGAGIEPAQPRGPRDFKSLASTNSATQADESRAAIYMLSEKRCQGIRTFSGYFEDL